MGLLSHGNRSAHVHADDEIQAYELTVEAFDRLLAENSRTGLAVLKGIARELSDRLRDTSGELRHDQ